MLRHCGGNVTTIAAMRSCCDDLWQSFNKIVVLFDLVSGCLGNPRRATFVACAVVYGSWLTLDPGGQLLLLLPIRHLLTADAAGPGSGFVVSMAAVWDSSHTPGTAGVPVLFGWHIYRQRFRRLSPLTGVRHSSVRLWFRMLTFRPRIHPLSCLPAACLLGKARFLRGASEAGAHLLLQRRALFQTAVLPVFASCCQGRPLSRV